MTYGAFSAQDFESYDRVARPARLIPQSVLCGVLLTLGASVGLLSLYGQSLSGSGASVRTAALVAPLAAMPPSRRDLALFDPTLTINRAETFAQSASLRSSLEARRGRALERAASAGSASQAAAVRVVDIRIVGMRAAAQTAAAQLASARPALTQSTVNSAAAIASPATAANAMAHVASQTLDADGPTVPDQQVATSESFARPAEASQVVPSLPQVSELVRDVPLPQPRPTLLARSESAALLPPAVRRTAQQAITQATAPAAPSDSPSFIEKLFGKATQPSGTALAYAAPEDGGLGAILPGRAPSADTATAVYDIAAHTVYLPNGTRLEAHSGLGSRLDDPRSVSEHMRGVTPPNVYDLAPREALFHGVRALRLTPVGSATTYGRAGLLAHTYMLGPRGDSNGCVVFKNYQAFLAAYDSGQIKRLAVVTRVN